MRGTIFLICLLFGIQSGQSQTIHNLEKLSLSADISAVLKGVSSFNESRHIPSTLPAVSTKEVQYFSFGTIKFTAGGEAGIKDAEASKISFLYRSGDKKDLAGLVIALEKTTESKLLGQYIAKHYGKATILSKVPLPNAKGMLIGYPARSYHDAIRKQTLIVADSYNIKNHQPALATWLFIIADNVKALNKGTSQTVVSLLTEMYTQ